MINLKGEREMRNFLRVLVVGIIGLTIAITLRSAGISFDDWQFWVVMMQATLLIPVLCLMNRE